MPFALFALLAQVAGAGSTVTGRVVEKGTTTPVSGARVILQAFSPMADGRQSPPEGTTVASGEFGFANVSPGLYRVTIIKAGFVPLMAFDRQPAEVRVEAGRPATFGTIALDRGGVVIGRVIDASGEPVVNARVNAFRQRGDLRSFVGITGDRRTNELGEFRLFALAPDDYIIGATPGSILGSAAANVRTISIATFAPGVASIEQGTPVTVTSGHTTTVDIRLLSAPAHSIAGVAVNADETPLSHGSVMLHSDGPLLFPGASTNVRCDENGRFVIYGVSSGRYRVAALPPSDRSRANVSGGVAVSLNVGVSGSEGTLVVVENADVANVRVVAAKR